MVLRPLLYKLRKEHITRSLNHKKKILLEGSLGKMVAHFSVLIFLKNIFEIKLLQKGLDDVPKP